MTARPSKRSAALACEESSLSDSASGRDDEKTIPFLRRLRDMLKENDDVISFVAGGYSKTGSTILGRIVVHDRIQVEENVLPQYFNHSSFASLRRQLNYFSFVRLGKGRQRESTYINDAVIELDDILHLKRRSSSGSGNKRAVISTTGTDEQQEGLREDPETGHLYGDAVVSMTPETYMSSHKQKRRRLPLGGNRGSAGTAAHAMHSRNSTPTNNLVSEDELSDGRMCPQQAPTEDLTLPDEEVLAGCSALLGLSTQQWCC